MATSLVQSTTFAVRGNIQRVPRESSHHSSFRGSKQRAFARLVRPRGVTPLATLGGTFISGGQQGRKGCFIPPDEDSIFEEAFVRGNDPFHAYRSPDEAGACKPNFEFFDEPVREKKTLAERLLEAETLSQAQVTAVAKVIAGEPQLLINLYQLGVSADEVEDAEKQKARMRAFNLFLRIVATMISEAGKEAIVHLFLSQRMSADSPTVMAYLASFARREVRKKYHHRTAFNAMRALGYEDPANQFFQ